MDESVGLQHRAVGHVRPAHIEQPRNFIEGANKAAVTPFLRSRLLPSEVYAAGSSSSCQEPIRNLGAGVLGSWGGLGTRLQHFELFRAAHPSRLKRHVSRLCDVGRREVSRMWRAVDSTWGREGDGLGE